ncbi:hypothetical protein WJX74_004092 [Apatococcus lobatus]|uniref:Uncharacterized protein n=2 Tax=Apatococcus TaxID=904362 RepID=A0AAW1T6F2_9CHLO
MDFDEDDQLPPGVDPDPNDGPDNQVPRLLPQGPAPIKIELKLEPGTLQESPCTPPPHQAPAASPFLFTPSRPPVIKSEVPSDSWASADAGDSSSGPPAIRSAIPIKSEAPGNVGNTSSAR